MTDISTYYRLQSGLLQCTVLLTHYNTGSSFNGRVSHHVTGALRPAGFPPERISEQLPHPSSQGASKSTYRIRNTEVPDINTEMFCNSNVPCVLPLQVQTSH